MDYKQIVPRALKWNGTQNILSRKNIFLYILPYKVQEVKVQTHLTYTYINIYTVSRRR